MNRKTMIRIFLVFSICSALFCFFRSQNSCVNKTVFEDRDGIRVVSIRTPVRQGDLCSLVIDGKPGIPYSASCTYLLGTFPETINQTKVSNSNGRVTWTWFVKGITSPGTYQIKVSGGGGNLTTSYTVIR